MKYLIPQIHKIAIESKQVAFINNLETWLFATDNIKYLSGTYYLSGILNEFVAYVVIAENELHN